LGNQIKINSELGIALVSSTINAAAMHGTARILVYANALVYSLGIIWQAIN